jgi:hypothetical protein
MNLSEVEAFIKALDNVQQEENFGYSFFFVGDDHRLAFVTIGHADNDFDTVSDLNREGVFRINIGISRQTYRSLLGEAETDAPDYAALDVFMPHPHYAKQNFVCILNPSADNAEITKRLIVEAHALAASRQERRTNI